MSKEFTLTVYDQEQDKCAQGRYLVRGRIEYQWTDDLNYALLFLQSEIEDLEDLRDELINNRLLGDECSDQQVEE